MAVIWQKKVADDCYEVRSAGNSIRLYKNRVFHSQWNEQRPLSNGVWDLLFLPALFVPAEQVRRILLLGVGGGAVINQFTTLLGPDKIVGVELDQMHIEIARRFFSVDNEAIELIEADAISWLSQYRGDKFDLIIEDLFTEKDGDPVRVAAADEKWFSVLLAHLHPKGMLVINFEGGDQMRESAPAYLASMGDRPDVRYRFSQPSYGNSVCAYLGQECQVADLRRRIDEVLTLFPACRAKGQKFKVRRIT
ncbi:hypothetical protein AB833_26045 [Chromatiales bacterium (ex Bugula neritina AB1)]|nr:hypothetical protein AB833_26045 [Chromatiales bacterium (ex Bugula neritina AB1)]